MLLRKLIFSSILLFAMQIAVGQGNKGTLTGKLVDSANKQPLSLATITVFNASDTTIISYRLSDPKGEFRIPGLPHNRASRVIVTYSGYRSFRHEFEMNSDKPDLDLGTIEMVNDPESLEEVVVTAERPPVIVRNDTIEFNASSFKTLPTALVEDLLKKLPGVQVDAQGNVMVNGKRVNRILVDGKAFFGDDPKMATRNLPANLIDKIQVADDKEEIDRSIDGDLSDIGKVINLSLKKGVKKGWFGKLYGGGGTDERYEAGGIANIFRDTLQLSILAFSNNVNRTGFSMKDVQDLGGFNRSGTNSIMIMSRGGNSGFALNGISFGGMDAGIARTSGAGFNLNHAPNKKQTIFAQYFYGHSKGILDELTSSQQFIRDTVLNTRSSSNSVSRNASHTINAGIRLKPDSVTDLNIRASYVNTQNNRNVFSTLQTNNNKLGLLSTGEGDKLNKTNDQDYNHSITYNKRSRRKKGRTLDLNHYFSYRNNLQNLITEQDNVFYIPVTDSILFEQLRVQDVPNMNGSLNINYTEPLTKQLSMRVSQQFQYERDEQVINTFERDNGNGKYEYLNEALSNGFFREQIRSNSTLSFTYRIKTVNISAGVNALWQDIHNNYAKSAANADMYLLDVMPNFNINWKRLSLRYSENVNAPSIQYMNPVPDNTNPFAIRLSNPNLVPTKRKNLSLNYYNFLPKSSLNLGFNIYSSFTDNDIVLARNIDERGVQVSIPVNVNGNRNLSGSGSVSKEFKNNTKFIFSTNARFWMNGSRQNLIVNSVSSTVNAMNISPSVGIGFNWNDVVEFRPEYRLNINKTRYTDASFTNLDITTHNFDAEFVLRWPKKLVWETNMNYRTNAQVAPGMPKTNFLWNAGLTYMMLKDDKGQLKLSVYDIMNDNNSFYRSVSQNYITDYRSNILQRYFLLTFTYNIRTMGSSKKVGGRDRMFFF